MGDKNAPQGLANYKVFSARNRMKLLLPFCLLVVGIVWSTSSLLPFNAVAESRLYLRQCTSCGEGGVGDRKSSSSSPHVKETLQSSRDQQAAHEERSGEKTSPGSDGSARHGMQAGSRSPRRTLVKEDEEVSHEDGVPVRNSNSPAEEEFQPDKPPQMEEMDILRTQLSAALMQSEKRAHGGDTGIADDYHTNGALRVLDEIRSSSLPFSSPIPKPSNPKPSSSCQGKYVYVYNLPPEFNVDLTKRCDSLVPWFGLCDYFTNSGFGKSVNDSPMLQPEGRWFNTHQYSLELVSHARILKYRCRTEDQSKASLFYIPYYGGLDVIRWHWALNATNANRDALGRKLVRWLERQPSWTRREGEDHVLVLGKISWDFRRQVTGDWGSRLLEFPEMQKVTKLLIERNPWHKNDIGVPHPTFFHPKSASDLRHWLSKIESHNRSHFVSFVGKDRHLDPTNVRSALIAQCRNATNKSCYFLECEQDKCLLPAYVTRVFLTSHFCMQPPGDSPTRRSVFDSLVAGCIPVLFNPCTAYLQYPWHLPRNASAWSVYVSETEVKSGKVNVMEVLNKISKEERDAMRRVIMSEIVPRIVYAEPGAEMAPFKDAFDVVLENLLFRAAHSPDLEQLA